MSAAPVRLAPVRRRLPFTLYVLAGLMLVKALALLALVAGATFAGVQALIVTTGVADLVAGIQGTPSAGVGVGLLGLLLVGSVVGLLLRRRLGWLLAMVITGLFVASDIFAFANGSANHAWMALNIVTVFYLNQRDVREAVGVALASEPDEDGPA